MQEKIKEMARAIDELLVEKPKETTKHAMNVATYLFDRDYRKQEWISVEDRLPERKGSYLVYIPNEPLICCMYYDCDASVYGDNGVTHWMPLPEPPKMKGGAK